MNASFPIPRGLQPSAPGCEGAHVGHIARAVKQPKRTDREPSRFAAATKQWGGQMLCHAPRRRDVLRTATVRGPVVEERATLGNASHHFLKPQRGCSLRLGHKRARPARSSPSPPLHGGEGDLPRGAPGQHAPEFAHCLLNLLVNSQPGGLAEGSRWSFRAQGETTTGKPRWMAEHPGGVPDPDRTCDSVARSSWLGSEESGTPCRGADIFCAITRRSPPPKPTATSGYLLATLRVDQAGMSKLPGALGQRALPPNASRISLAALPRCA